ncbi:SIR2 family protein [Pleomorphomonas koreensis]|uniref:SIR2 family protein n=1 Tax=Pleomorphomonas koreensis TaxID=257440 RepID=UPI000415F0BF|nr:SIR2 family protein [Pleomorphomonas koreensis]
MTLDLVKRIAVMEGEEVPADSAEWYRTRYGKEPEYSALLDTLAKSPAERRAILHALFEPTADEREQGLKLPTEAHRAIAKLVASGHIRLIITTNFDRLMELALQDEGITPTVISTADAVIGAAPIVHQRCVVLKLHGDYLDDRIKNTEEELASYDHELDGYLDRILDEFGLIICGWSGDWDIALRAAIERTKSRRYTTYWTAKGKPSERAAKLITLRGAQVIEIASADEFFGGLADKVASLDELNAGPPLSVAIAVASLKRFMADPVHRIRFHDLLINETERVLAINAAMLAKDAEVRPDVVSAKRRFEQYDANTEILRALLYNAAYWAEPHQVEPIERSVRMLADVKRADGYTTWQEMRIYPAVVCFYAACLGAIAGANWATFQRLLQIPVGHGKSASTSLPELVAYHAIEKGTAKLIDDKQAWYFPLSEHFARRLFSQPRGRFEDYDTEIDRLEVMFALVFVDQQVRDTGDVAYMPVGRFAAYHLDSAYERLFAEAEAAGENWPPLKSGMYGGSIDRFKTVTIRFRQILGKRPYR